MKKAEKIEKKNKEQELYQTEIVLSKLMEKTLKMENELLTLNH